MSALKPLALRPPVVPALASLRGWLAALLLLLGGCAGMLPVVDRKATATQAIPAASDTPLGRMAGIAQPEPGLSGVRLMPLGTFSLDTRVQLARRAQVSLDVQYYHVANDETGRWLLRALRDAAQRGVRVRLLLDDLASAGSDWLFLGLGAYPNVQVRVYNPFCCARGSGPELRLLSSLGDLDRVNHRMHNKMFVADGAMAIIGGRNIANDYYLRNAGSNYIDVDAFIVGAVLPDIQTQFDRYWNSTVVYPLQAVSPSGQSPEQLRARFEEATGAQATPAPAPLASNDILGYGPLADDLDAGRLGLIWAKARVFADDPEKPAQKEMDGKLLESSVTYTLLEAIGQARQEAIGVTPYLVPGPRGMAFMKKTRARGVKLVIVTNSLGSTDQPLVHTGYARYRKDMLKLGVDLYEISAARLKLNKRAALFGSRLGRLHAKLMVIDRQTSFIGSMNLDHRSAALNTEFGALIDSPEVARELIRIIDIDRLQSAYRVQLAPNGEDLQWEGMDNEHETVLRDEPEAPLWLRFEAWLMSVLVSEDQL